MEETIHSGNEVMGIEDMIHLDVMSEHTILKNLQVRYGKNLIYVRSPSLLVHLGALWCLS